MDLETKLRQALNDVETQGPKPRISDAPVLKEIGSLAVSYTNLSALLDDLSDALDNRFAKLTGRIEALERGVK